jgi:hypothetical protein
MGAWSLDTRPALERLGANAVACMLAASESTPRLSEEVTTNKLWLVADARQVSRQGSCVGAAEGFLALRGDTIQAAHARAVAQRVPFFCDGHYVLVEAHLDTPPRLTLLRTISGGEHLYFAELDRLIVFASSVRVLLANPQISDRLHSVACNEILMTGHVTHGDHTAFQSIREVLPGHQLTVNDAGATQTWFAPWRQCLSSPEGSVDTLAGHFRERLTAGVEAAVVPGQRIAVALSGGIDSSAIAAAAVDVVGADNVVAYSYEFDDPRHPTETHFAAAVCKALDIRDHRVFRLDFESFLTSIPEAVWRSESPVYWPKPFMLDVARRIQEDGFDRYLTGFGIGSHMAYMEDLARLLGRLANPERALLAWTRARFRSTRWMGVLGKLHPGLQPPHPRLHYPLVRILVETGVIDDPKRFFPDRLAPLYNQLQSLTPSTEKGQHFFGFEDRAPRERWLREQLQLFAIRHLVSCVDVTRVEKSSREIGVHRISPAHFPSCIPYAYFPVHSGQHMGKERDLRPGKYLLRMAYKRRLPDTVLYRQKSWADAVASPGWLRRGRALMQRALPGFPGSLGRLGASYPSAIRYWEPRSIHAMALSFEFMHRIICERHAAAPPTWAELIPGFVFGKRHGPSTSK